MAILKVARMGNPILRRVADPIPVEQITAPEVQGLIADMLDTVVEYNGVGLAAPQVPSREHRYGILDSCGF